MSARWSLRATAAVLLAGSALLAGARGAHADGGVAPSPPAPAPPAPGPGYATLDLPGIQKALRAARGHAVVLHFWATWCLPCLEELPVMEKFARDAKARGVEVMSLSLDDPDKSGQRVAKVLGEVAPSLTRTIALVDDPDRFIGQFGAWEGSIPAVFAYDAQGQLRDQIVGETDRKALDDLVRKVLKPKGRAPR